MPMIQMYGVNMKQTGQGDLKNIIRKAKKAAVSIDGLGLKMDQVSVVFMPNLYEGNFDGEIIIRIVDLYERRERSDLVRNNLAEAIGLVAENNFKYAKSVKCNIGDIAMPENGSWRSKSSETAKCVVIATCACGLSLRHVYSYPQRRGDGEPDSVQLRRIKAQIEALHDKGCEKTVAYCIVAQRNAGVLQLCGDCLKKDSTQKQCSRCHLPAPYSIE